MAKVIKGMDHELGDALRALVMRELRNELCWVSFQKADGTKRKMFCTLLQTFLPDAEPRTSAAIKAAKMKLEAHPFLITVWDVEKMEWRAFNLDKFYRLTVI